jgi:hypothetical protein
VHLAGGLSLNPDDAVLGRFGFLDHDAQGMRTAPAVITNFHIGHDLLRTALRTLSVFHGFSPLDLPTLEIIAGKEDPAVRRGNFSYTGKRRARFSALQNSRA